jgi:hypothetical protein
VSPKPKRQLAREHLERALPAVTADDYPEAVTWLFASLEAAVMALAEQHDIDVPPNHFKKAEVAAGLYASGQVSSDFSAPLRALNSARKAAIYDGDEPDLGDWSLEDISMEVEHAVDLAEELLA